MTKKTAESLKEELPKYDTEDVKNPSENEEKNKAYAQMKDKILGEDRKFENKSQSQQSNELGSVAQQTITGRRRLSPEEAKAINDAEDALEESRINLAQSNYNAQQLKIEKIIRQDKTIPYRKEGRTRKILEDGLLAEAREAPSDFTEKHRKLLYENLKNKNATGKLPEPPVRDMDPDENIELQNRLAASKVEKSKLGTLAAQSMLDSIFNNSDASELVLTYTDLRGVVSNISDKAHGCDKEKQKMIADKVIAAYCISKDEKINIAAIKVALSYYLFPAGSAKKIPEIISDYLSAVQGDQKTLQRNVVQIFSSVIDTNKPLEVEALNKVAMKMVDAIPEAKNPLTFREKIGKVWRSFIETLPALSEAGKIRSNLENSLANKLMSTKDNFGKKPLPLKTVSLGR